MKMVKSLLLGSAAGVVAIAGAQAADLPVKAKPVEYVKICTLYGDGFYYIPGSDTCIRFSGYIRADYGYNVTGARTPNYSGAAGAQDRTVNNYSTRHRGSFSIDTRTQTAYGTLRTFQTLHMQNENTVESTNIARAFIQWGGFTFGRTVSFTDHEGSLGDFGMRSLHQTQNQSDTGANGINQIAYTWQLGNGITLNVGADERRVKSIANCVQSARPITQGVDPTSSRTGSNHPNPWVSLRVNQAWGRASVAVIANHNEATYYTRHGRRLHRRSDRHDAVRHPNDKWGWAVIAGTEIKLDMLSPGSRLRLPTSTTASVLRPTAAAATWRAPASMAAATRLRSVRSPMRSTSTARAWNRPRPGRWVAASNTSGPATSRARSTATTPRSATTTPWSTNRWFCGGGGGVSSAFNGTTCDPASSTGRSARTTTGSRCRVCGLRST